MKRVIVILVGILLLSGCSNKIGEYKEVSDIVVGLFQNDSYSKDKLNASQIRMIENYITTLNNPEINVSDFLIANELYKTQEKNTSGVYVRDNKCYIKYKDIIFESPGDHVGESTARVICNGYTVILFEDSVKPRVADYQNPKYNYRYLGYYVDNGYHFAYRSYYDGSGLIVTVDDEVMVKFADVNSLNLSTSSSVSYSKYIKPIILIIGAVGIIVFLKNRFNNK